jgi:hypothetical protein
MGWGIRGQYGHESGAMIAGVLVALAIALLFCQRRSSLAAARIVALTAVGVSFGGAMTYGQTVGLTQDAELHGHWEALRWGMLGLFIKGGIWIGFAAVLLGVGLSGKRYRALEMLLLFLFLMGLHLLGLYLLNEPFDPPRGELPRIYFSDHWHWEPGKPDLVPRQECWGGLLLALVGLWLYAAAVKRDAIARNLGLFGVVFGGLGFVAGQSVQAYHSWNAADFQQGWLAQIEPYMNWWNTMETVFGAVMGLGLGLGVWLHRRRLPTRAEDEDVVELPPAAELVLVAGHAAAFAVWNFVSFPRLDQMADQSLAMGLAPLALILGGRYAPYLIALPVVALPICGKTLRELTYLSDAVPPVYGWTLLIVLPLTVLTVAAIALARRGRRPEGADAAGFTRWSLLLTSWVYFALNFAFFRFPWPWEPPTRRTPSAIAFTACLAILTLAAATYRPRPTHPETPRP